MKIESNTNSTAACDPEIAEPINGVSPDLTEESINANLEPLNEISALTHLLKQLIQENSARNSPMVGLYTQQKQSRHSPSQEAETSRASPATATGNMGFPPDKNIVLTQKGEMEKLFRGFLQQNFGISWKRSY